MKVLFLPDGSQSNPYQLNLAKSLEKFDVQVAFGNSFRLFPILRALKVHGKPSILHLHWTHGFMVSDSHAKTIILASRFLFELLIVKLLGVKIVWTVHNLVQHERWHTNLERFFNRILVPLYDQLIVHCQYAQEAVIQSYHLPDRCRGKIHVIPIGHYIDNYENNMDQEQARAELALGTEEKVFLFIGLIRPYKGVFQLIDAFGKIENNRIRLLVVGRPDSETTRSGLLERCRLDDRILPVLEFVPSEKIQLYMNAADVVVLPFQDILTSASALLAMSFGKAVVIPKMGCIPEVLDDAGTIFYNCEEEEGLLEAMEKALHADLAEMGQYNFKLAEALGWDGIARKTSQVYHSK